MPREQPIISLIPPTLPPGYADDRANFAMSSGRPDRRTTSSSPGRQFPVPRHAVSSGRPDCRMVLFSPFAFPQATRPLPCSGTRHAERAWSFNSAIVPLNSANALITKSSAASGSLRQINEAPPAGHFDCDLDARLPARAA
jgi:hypothetical protein